MKRAEAILHDAHCHFFSPNFFRALARQKQLRSRRPVAELTRLLMWDDPLSVDDLADRWVSELDRYGVQRAALIASVPGDEKSVARAVKRHPDRFVGFFVLDPGAPNVLQRADRAFEGKMQCACLFPSMHHFSVSSPSVRKLFMLASRYHAAIFIHCGVLSVGVRKKLGLTSRFDLRYSNPVEVQILALDFPQVPVIIPHFGGGFFREALMLADMCPNVYLDTSSSNAWIRYVPGLTLDQVFRQALDVLGPQRLLFGTDSSYFPRGWQYPIWQQQKAILRRLKVSAVDQQQIFSKNFEKLFVQQAATNAAPGRRPDAAQFPTPV
ncbi:MAG: amidohydrolase [Acidobacteria bacterium]|nr:amidohydrolase [Acidobacteriota bacterium]